jgi:hypothetical protein
VRAQFGVLWEMRRPTATTTAACRYARNRNNRHVHGELRLHYRDMYRAQLHAQGERPMKNDGVRHLWKWGCRGQPRGRRESLALHLPAAQRRRPLRERHWLRQSMLWATSAQYFFDLVRVAIGAHDGQPTLDAL